MLKKYFAVSLIYKIFIGLILGVVLGLLLGTGAAVLAPFGELFVRSLKMIVMPIVFLTITLGVASIQPSRLGRVGGKILAFYLGTSVVAITLGLTLATFFKLGVGLELPIDNGYVANVVQPSVVDLLLRCIPTNPFGALAGGDPLPVITTAIFLGLALAYLQDHTSKAVQKAASTTHDVFFALTEAAFLIVRAVMEYAPIGVVALIAGLVGIKGPAVLGDFAKLVAVAYLGMTIHIILVYGGLLKLNGLSPIRFLRGAKEALITAYATRTSSGTLPVSISCAEHNLRVPNKVAGFTLSLGATINMDGTALYLAMEVVFAANVFGLDFGMAEYITIMVTALVSSIGAAGVPSASLVMLTTILQSVGLKPTIIPLLAGFDPICDMMRTVTNVAGDLTGTVLVAKSEGELDTTRGVWVDGSPDGFTENALEVVGE